MTTKNQSARAGDGNLPAPCNCPNIGYCDGSCAPYNQPSDALPKLVQTAPAKVYLVVGEDCPPETDFAELTRSYEDLVTWCADKIDDNSIEYVRADLAAAPAVPHLNELRRVLRRLRLRQHLARPGLPERVDLVLQSLGDAQRHALIEGGVWWRRWPAAGSFCFFHVVSLRQTKKTCKSIFNGRQ